MRLRDMAAVFDVDGRVVELRYRRVVADRLAGPYDESIKQLQASSAGGGTALCGQTTRPTETF